MSIGDSGITIQNGGGGGGGGGGETYSLQVGQVVIATTGTAVQLSTSTAILANGLVVSAGNSNAAIVSTSGSTGGTIGTSSVNNKTDGTGNGQVISPGGSMGIVGNIVMNTLYVNGIAGDVFSWIGN